MGKKQSKTKNVKKAIKASKAKSLSKIAKTPKKIITKSVRPLTEPKKIVKKKPNIKKAAKSSTKAVKPAPAAAGKVVTKSSKPSKKISIISPKAGKEAVKKTAEKTILPVKSLKNVQKAVKPVIAEKAAKSEKSVAFEKEKPVKTELFDVVKKPKRKKKKQKSEDDDEPVIIEDILIEQLIQSTKRKAKVPKVPKILKTFVNPMASLTVAVNPDAGKKGSQVPKKEPKGKFELEYVVRTSTGILYELLTTPSGLSEWFADDVNIRDGIFTFFWDGSEQKARLLGFKEDQYIRMQWIDKPEGSYFEFRIQRDELTGDISLMITDFADEASDMQTSKLLWDSQVNTLLNVLGSN